MEKHYAETHYIQDLEALFKDHELQLLNVSAEQQAAQGFKSKIKEECDSFAKDIKNRCRWKFWIWSNIRAAEERIVRKIDIFMVKIEVV